VPYYYAVKGACDPGGLTESTFSNEVAATTFGPRTRRATTANVCTQTDTCRFGACVGSNPIVCTASDQCHDAGTCNSGTGVCSNPPKANGATCSDGNPCTAADSCQAGSCSAVRGHLRAERSVPRRGSLRSGDGTCSNPAKADGSPCSDGSACTEADSCQSGACAAGTAAADGTPCSDNNACTDGDSCQSGACAAGTPVPGPGATEGLAFADLSNLSWSSAPAATAYDVIRGTLSVLKSGGFATAVDSCVSDSGPSTSISDSHIPAAARRTGS
jgi:hypothetical protein